MNKSQTLTRPSWTNSSMVHFPLFSLFLLCGYFHYVISFYLFIFRFLSLYFLRIPVGYDILSLLSSKKSFDFISFLLIFSIFIFPFSLFLLFFSFCFIYVLGEVITSDDLMAALRRITITRKGVVVLAGFH